NALSGVALSGDRFFYVNRLASAGDGRDLRWERASLECCPPNLVRFLASMPGFVYAQDSHDAVYVNLYVSSDVSFAIGGQDLTLNVESEMPWSGKSTIKVSSKNDLKGTIKLRIPGWARNQPVPGTLYAYEARLDREAIVSLNGRTIVAAPDRLGYVSIDRVWHTGDVIDIDLPVEIRRVTADSHVRDDRSRIAVERGPVVFCHESLDRAQPSGDQRVLDLLVDRAAEMKLEHDPQLFGGMNVIRTEARKLSNPSLPPEP